MPIEINLGERFGKFKISIEKERSTMQILQDLSKDKRALTRARTSLFLDGKDAFKLIKRAKGNLPDRIVVIKHKEAEFFSEYKYTLHTLTIAPSDGSLYDEMQHRPKQSEDIRIEDIGLVSLDDETKGLNLKYPPHWLAKDIKPEDLQEAVNSIFYPDVT